MYPRRRFAKPAMSKVDVPDMHSESIEELREAFELFDIKGIGEISLGELVDSMQSLGLHDKNPMMFEMVLKLSTRREGGNITFKEFTEDIADLIRNIRQEKDLRAVFDMFDEDHTGRISLENLKKVATEFGEACSDAELLEMLDTAKQLDPGSIGDPDELTNEVTFLDFYHLMTRNKATGCTSLLTPSTMKGRSGPL